MYRKLFNKSRTNKRAQNTTLAVECLENRRLMAADISLAANGLLSIKTGTAADNVRIYSAEGKTQVSIQMGNAALEKYSFTKVYQLDIRTYAGNDTISNETRIPSIVLSGNGNDSVYGGSGADTIYGGNGNDYLYGSRGNDTIYGDAGKDRILGGGGEDLLVGDNVALATSDAAIAAMKTGVYNDFIDGGADDDWIVGLLGDDRLVGGGGDDIVYGNMGNDEIHGDGIDGLNYVRRDAQYSGNDSLYAGDGNDQIYGGYGKDQIMGEHGDDVIVGGEGDDFLMGDAGNDHMYGAGGNDHLWGGDGNADWLYGEEGDDWLDAGSGAEGLNTSIGGNGNDFNAYITKVGGTSAIDIAQGGSKNCFILASIAAVNNTGVDLSSRITYRGNGYYDVALFQQVGSSIVTVQVPVQFDGTLRSTDPVAHFRGQEGESWAIIMNRAIASHLGVDLNKTNGGDAGPVLFALTGRNVTGTFALFTGDIAAPLTTNSRDLLIANFQAGRAIIAGTRNTQEQMTGNMFAADHVYTVLNVIPTYIFNPFGPPTLINCDIILYNPWGIDVNADSLAAGTATASGANDGVIAVNWEMFRLNFDEIRFA